MLNQKERLCKKGCDNFCIECAELTKLSSNRKPCATRACPASRLMQEELSLFMGIFNILKSELYAGQAWSLLKHLRADDMELEAFARLDAYLKQYQVAQLKNKA